MSSLYRHNSAKYSHHNGESIWHQRSPSATSAPTSPLQTRRSIQNATPPCYCGMDENTYAIPESSSLMQEYNTSFTEPNGPTNHEFPPPQDPQLRIYAPVASQSVTVTQYPPQNLQVTRSKGTKKQNVQWSWAPTFCSMISIWLCFCFCGFIGLMYAIHAYVDHKSGDWIRASNKRRRAWVWTSTGILWGTICWICFLLFLVVNRENLF